ncbi:hypothetical protein [Streptomyces alboviridis]|uniref:hypothetical protein n=1 Tax=Streptomyces alboviridis TaxID=67269 RepID=UPI00131A5ABB|nr:hypothetical protein [Streptomyces alboviridis]
MSNTDPTEPVRFTLPMKPSFREKAVRSDVIGAPIRWRLGDDTLMEGVVVEWEDEQDGGVTLTVEATSTE